MKQLTINDLMIGDWIRNDFGELQQIVEIRDDGVMLAYNDIYPYDKIEPIPITPEILEKNWVDSDTNVFGLCDYELSKSYILENRGDRCCFVKRVLGYGSTFHIIDVKYVHELQHALRLCGIDKEIEL